MRFFAFIILMLLLVAPAGMLPAAAAADDTTPSQPPGDVAPKSGLPGTRFAFYATGFDDGENITYWFNAPDGRIIGDRYAYITNSHKGRADWQWQSNYNEQPGRWTAVAYGVDSGVERLIPFTIEHPDGEPAAPAPGESPAPASPPATTTIVNPSDVAVQPLRGYPDTRFAFFATGYADGEVVHFWATDPRGENYGSNRGYKVKANGNGRADWTWRVPDQAAYGRWMMIGWGEQSHVERVIFFEVLDPTIPEEGEAEAVSFAVEPAGGVPGDTLWFFARVFMDDEQVRFEAYDPNGTRYQSGKDQVTADPNGRADWSWKIPADAMPGTWHMLAIGKASEAVQEIPFEVYPATED
jgi:hypothetical protein